MNSSFQDVEEYRPLQLGGFQVGIAFIFLPLFTAWTVSLVVPYVDLYDLVTIVFLMAGFVVALWFAMFGGNPLKWWKQYWRRNVRGYVMRCVARERYWESGKVTFGYETMTPSEDRATGKLSGKHPIGISLALGGWFRKSHILVPNTAEARFSLFRNWRVKLHSITNSGMVLVEMRYGHRGRKRDERVVMDAERAIRLLELVIRDGAMVTDIGGVITYLDIERHHAAKERDELRLEQERLVESLRELARQLESTSRFVHSREGLRAYVRVLEELVAAHGHMKAHDQLRCESEKLKQARAKLAQLEKRAAARKRRKRARAASAASA